MKQKLERKMLACICMLEYWKNTGKMKANNQAEYGPTYIFLAQLKSPLPMSGFS
jgi:hypothetical protein